MYVSSWGYVAATRLTSFSVTRPWTRPTSFAFRTHAFPVSPEVNIRLSMITTTLNLLVILAGALGPAASPEQNFASN